MFLGIPTVLNQVSQFIKKEHHYIMLFYTKCILIFLFFFLFQSQAKKQQVAYCANTRWHPWVATSSCVQHLSWPQRGAVKPLKAYALIHTRVWTVLLSFLTSVTSSACARAFMFIHHQKECACGRQEWLSHSTCCVCCSCCRCSVYLSNFLPTSWSKYKSGISQSILKFLFIWMMKVVCSILAHMLCMLQQL